MKVTRARIGDILELQRRVVTVDTENTYREVGVRSFARGIFIKPTVTGHELGAKRVFYIEPGDLVVSNIFAWEGAVAVATGAHADTIGSHRFMTWTPIADVDQKYLAHYFASDSGLQQLQEASPGSAGRNRTLSIKNFEQIEVPLPSLPDQRRIVAHLDSVGEGSSVQNLSPRSLSDVAAQGALSAALQQMTVWRPLGELATINPSPRRVHDEELVAFVPMRAVSDATGTITQKEVRRRSDVGTGYKQAIAGDIIFARITPCMQNGKTAIYRPDEEMPMYGSTEFHVLRAPAEVTPWIHTVLRSDWFIQQAKNAFTGTAGQQRVPAGFLRTVRIPVPTNPEIATASVNRLLREQFNVAHLAMQAAQLRAALLPAARNEVFSVLR